MSESMVHARFPDHHPRAVCQLQEATTVDVQSNCSARLPMSTWTQRVLSTRLKCDPTQRLPIRKMRQLSGPYKVVRTLWLFYLVTYVLPCSLKIETFSKKTYYFRRQVLHRGNMCVFLAFEWCVVVMVLAFFSLDHCDACVILFFSSSLSTFSS